MSLHNTSNGATSVTIALRQLKDQNQRHYVPTSNTPNGGTTTAPMLPHTHVNWAKHLKYLNSKVTCRNRMSKSLCKTSYRLKHLQPILNWHYWPHSSTKH